MLPNAAEAQHNNRAFLCLTEFLKKRRKEAVNKRMMRELRAGFEHIDFSVILQISTG